MTSNLFIVYRITNIVERKHYYGYKSCGKRDPKEIIGKTYYSSSTDKEFIKEQKNHPERFRYKIVARYSTKEEALEREIRLHALFDVSENPSFYNRAKQTSKNFTTTGYRPATPRRRARRGPSGKIYVTNGTATKMVSEEIAFEYINAGWRRGKTRKQKTRKVFVNDGEKNLYIPYAELGLYISNGWQRGRTNMGYRSKRIRINDGKKTIVIYPEEWSRYQSEGWSMGILPYLGNQDRTRINNGEKELLVNDSVLREFTENGWVIGRVPKTRVYVNNGIEERVVTKEESERLLLEGWEMKRLCTTNKGRRRMHRGGVEICARTEEIHERQKEGYILGRTPKEATQESFR